MAGTVEGDQTVPRSELTAMKIILQQSGEARKKEEIIVADHKAIIDKIAARRVGEANADLWTAIRRAYDGEEVVCGTKRG